MIIDTESTISDTDSTIKSKLIDLLTTLLLVFKKIKGENKRKFDNFCSSLKAAIVIIESDNDNDVKINDVFQSTILQL